MDASFSIDADPSRDLIRVSLSGFFTSGSFNAFLDKRRKAHARLRCGPNEHVTLVDIREMNIQTQEMVGQFYSVLSDPAYHSRRIAFVVASTLTRSQLIRAIGSRPTKYFTDPDAAEQWLFEDLIPYRAATAAVR